MTYFTLRQFRLLLLQSRLLSSQIRLEQERSAPDRGRIKSLKRLRLSLMDRISGHLKQHAPA